MPYTVGEVARITRLSVRALHHYHEIGLVAPSGRTRARYRLYTDADLERLQQVVLFRELGLKLEDIASILNDPAFDRRKALVAQRALLLEKIGHQRAVLALVDRTIAALDGETTMKQSDLFELEAKERWGETDAYKESARRTARYTDADWARLKVLQKEILDAFADAAEAGIAPEDPRATAIAERHRLLIDEWFYPCSRRMHAALGRMYVDDPRFSANFEVRRAGLAEYVCAAIRACEAPVETKGTRY